MKFDFGTHRKVLLTEIKQVFPAEEEKRDVWSFKWKTGCRQTSTAEIENENSHIYIGAIRKSADRKKTDDLSKKCFSFDDYLECTVVFPESAL